MTVTTSFQRQGLAPSGSDSTHDVRLGGRVMEGGDANLAGDRVEQPHEGADRAPVVGGRHGVGAAVRCRGGGGRPRGARFRRRGRRLSVERGGGGLRRAHDRAGGLCGAVVARAAAVGVRRRDALVRRGPLGDLAGRPGAVRAGVPTEFGGGGLPASPISDLGNGRCRASLGRDS